MGGGAESLGPTDFSRNFHFSGVRNELSIARGNITLDGEFHDVQYDPKIHNVSFRTALENQFKNYGLV